MSETQMIPCAACGAVNRVPTEKLQVGRTAVCGRCKEPLQRRPSPIVVTDATFAEQVERSPLPVLLDMWAPWCGPCRAVGPIVEEIAGELAGQVRVGKMNVDDNQATAGRFGIQSIPALLLFQNGREVDRIIGAQPKTEILRRVRLAFPRN
jgi:thioredoxin 2